MSYSSVILAEPSLVTFCELSETSGTAATDSKDGNNGGYNGTFTLNQTPVAGPAMPAGAVLFPDPGGGTSGYVGVGNPANLQIDKPFTLECWINLNNNGANSYTIMSHGLAGWCYRVEATTAKLHYLKSFTTDLLTGNTALSQGVWYHTAVKVDSGGTITLYVNGVPDGSVGGAPSLAFTESFDIGNDRNTNKFGGLLACAAVYNTALSDASLLAHYNARLNNPTGGGSNRGGGANSHGGNKGGNGKGGGVQIQPGGACSYMIIGDL